MSRAALHVQLLGRLYVVAGWLSLLASISLVLLGVGAVSLTSRAGPEVAASLAAAIFFGSAVVTLVWAGVLIYVGWGLPQYQPWARPAALVLAIVNVFVIPFGTALSVYASWVLLQEGGKRLFERGQAGGSAV
ncbi:hypothetical protein TBR22_A46960 [Luteitalea sp. TBR-22]|uniref:hypothetical protein n=1 Tax=Luteitalea sp. TBR-22 TaxID=2802971 RepID=UPI001AFB8E57|nr:hypothetical protein [Luteitalea sp. TBR-22]BCS35469.1 hypothetical protein TBR22_A46960 [Luteitalea sp. TBR-22]